MSIQYKKNLGQHILKNPGIIDKIIECSQILETDTVLEIGSGTGNLTVKLLEKARKVICYEKDERMAAELVKRVKSLNLSHKMKLFVGDCMKSDFPHFDLCISNIPYQISSVLIFKLFNYNFRAVVLMLQHEFAMRLVARPGSPEYSRLSVSSQLFSKTEYMFKVSRKNFNPMPKVESAVVKIRKRIDQPNINVPEFENFLRICFKRKNKTLNSVFGDKSTIKKMKRDKTEITAILNTFGIKRASKLNVEDFLQVFLNFKLKRTVFT